MGELYVKYALVVPTNSDIEELAPKIEEYNSSLFEHFMQNNICKYDVRPEGWRFDGENEIKNFLNKEENSGLSLSFDYCDQVMVGNDYKDLFHKIKGDKIDIIFVDPFALFLDKYLYLVEYLLGAWSSDGDKAIICFISDDKIFDYEKDINGKCHILANSHCSGKRCYVVYNRAGLLGVLNGNDLKNCLNPILDDKFKKSLERRLLDEFRLIKKLK